MSETVHPATLGGPERKSVSAALESLRKAQKPSAGAPAYSRFVNRPLGRMIAAVAFVIGLTPNQVTAISAAFTLAGIAVIAAAPPMIVTGIAAALLLVVGYAFDAADGQLARLRGGGSLAGEWLDHVVDAFKASLLHAAVLVSWFRFGPVDGGMLLVPLGFMVVSAVFFFCMILTDQLRRLHRGSSAMILQRSGPTSALYALAVVPADYGLLCVVFLLFGLPVVFAVLYTALFAANVLVLLVCLVRWFRAVRALD
ncbi:CDP-alcohol phosphatidyltransferase family protein [Leifsonia sp. NPDC080035]|uniref:CDP-alcohol phosphatidyltransferase family protein n=1 Tax=Leifsonia sp. NPDC080035 TaxID=3143936 RepID=A0AAU7GCZ3_9MICO